MFEIQSEQPMKPDDQGPHILDISPIRLEAPMKKCHIETAPETAIPCSSSPLWLPCLKMPYHIPSPENLPIHPEHMRKPQKKSHGARSDFKKRTKCWQSRKTKTKTTPLRQGFQLPSTILTPLNRISEPSTHKNPRKATSSARDGPKQAALP